MQELIRLTAGEVVDLLARREITPLDCLDALEGRIAEVDTAVNALPTLCFERAREHALRLMDGVAEERGILCGLPVPIKDLSPVAGVRTTFGSRVYEGFVPDHSGIVAETLERNGALIYAKSNTPEFGTGGNTFNEVFGPTRNPHDLSLSAGGSSGGAAAALASGTAWLAHGSDMAGSLRTPASFCGVASLRPSPGLIATDPDSLPFQVLAQEGAMARTVPDLALLTDAMVGASSRAGLCKPRAPGSFRAAAAQPRAPARVAFSADLGITETDPEVIAVCEQALAAIADAGVGVVRDQPDLSASHRAFDVLRALGYAAGLGELSNEHRRLIKPEVAWNVDRGLALDGAEIRLALTAQGRLFETAARFMQRYDLLICPAAAVLPYPVTERYPGYAAGLGIPHYYRWLAIAYAVTMTSLPVITLPCGTSASGLPIGIQLIGRPHGERRLFAAARFVEQVLGLTPAPRDPVGDCIG